MRYLEAQNIKQSILNIVASAGHMYVKWRRKANLVNFVQECHHRTQITAHFHNNFPATRNLFMCAFACVHHVSLWSWSATLFAIYDKDNISL